MTIKSCCISLITLSLGDLPHIEYIIFSDFKEVYEIPPPSIYFYPKKGGSNEASKLFTLDLQSNGKVAIRQWFGICDLDYASDIRTKILSGNQFLFENKSIVFMASSDNQRKTITSDPDSIGDIPHYSGYISEAYEYRSYAILDNINFHAYRYNLIDNLKKDTTSEEFLLDIFPYGYYTNKDLQELISNKILLRYTKIYFLGTFHGDRSTIKREQGDPSSFIGYIHDAPIPRESMRVILSEDIDGLSASENAVPINPDSGVWTFDSRHPFGNGYIGIINRETDKLIAGEHFVLLKQFNVNIVPYSETVIDLYEKRIPFSRDEINKKRSIPTPMDQVFFRESFQNVSETEYEEKVSNYLEGVIKYLAPVFLICDPYLLGNLEIVDKKVKLNKGQRVFINALFRALTQIKIDEICILGNHSRTKQFWKDEECIPDAYRVIFDELKKIQNFNVIFKITNTAFHDRRLLKLMHTHPKLTVVKAYEISTSIGGIIESGEFKLNELSGINAERVSYRVLHLWDNASFSTLSL